MTQAVGHEETGRFDAGSLLSAEGSQLLDRRGTLAPIHSRGRKRKSGSATLGEHFSF
jgi:hypothetical protein